MKIIRNLLPIILILIVSYWSIKPLLISGFFPIHDDTQVARVFEMYKSLKDGMFPVRWVGDLGYGYGYPIFNFYAPFAYYVGALFMFLGFSALAATELMIGLGVVLAGIFIYFLAKEFWGKTGGVVAAALYVYAPYHALNIYVRGAIAELWAYAIIPLTFLAIYKVFLGLSNYIDLVPNSKFKTSSSAKATADKQNLKLKLKNKRSIWNWVCISGLSYAAIVISHNLTAMMVTPFLFIFAVFLYLKLRMGDKVYKPYFVLLGLLLGIMLSAFYWIPALFEMMFTDVLSVVGGGSDYKDHFVCLSQLWNSPWGFGGSAPGCMDGMSYKIGKLHIVLGIFSILTLFILRKKDRIKFQLSSLFFIFLIVSIFLLLGGSKFIWDAIPHMAFFQFPWRFLVLVTFFISFFGGAILMCLPSTNLVWVWVRRGVGTIAIVSIVFVNAEVFTPQKILGKEAENYTSKQELNWRVSKISDEYMPKGFFKPLRAIDVPNSRFESKDDFEIVSLSEKTQQITATVDIKDKTTLYANIAYFPGWHVFIDGKQVWFKYSGQGLLIDIPKGRHFIDIRFTQTPIEKTANSLSIASVIVLLAGIISHRNKYNNG